MSFYTSTATSSVWKKQKLEIAASSNEKTTEIALSRFRGVKYILTLYGSTKTKKIEISVINQNGSLKSTVSLKLGLLDVTIEEQIISGKMSLKITNNESFDIIMKGAYLILDT